MTIRRKNARHVSGNHGACARREKVAEARHAKISETFQKTTGYDKIEKRVGDGYAHESPH